VTCREFAEFIADYLAGDLPAPHRQEFDRHLARCANCARYLDGYRRTIEMSQSAFEPGDATLPADVPEELVKAILRARRSPIDH
jgi:anti-sigma factor RsiW